MRALSGCDVCPYRMTDRILEVKDGELTQDVRND